MPNTRRDGQAICPFYEHSDKNIIRCECAIGGSRLMHVFGSTEECEDHVQSFCCAYAYLGCPYAEMLIWEYDTGKR